jgi:DNA-directed RNA polymerase specialized sigma24 family protein
MYSEIGSQTSVRELAGTLYRDKRNYLLRVARHNALNDAHAEEALQEAFASFLRAFDPNGEAPPLAWLALALKRECWRKRRDEHLDRRIGQAAERHGEEAGSILELIPARGPSLEDRVSERDRARRCFGVLSPMSAPASASSPLASRTARSPSAEAGPTRRSIAASPRVAWLWPRPELRHTPPADLLAPSAPVSALRTQKRPTQQGLTRGRGRCPFGGSGQLRAALPSTSHRHVPVTVGSDATASSPRTCCCSRDGRSQLWRLWPNRP